jgi:hypothetical protein
MDQRLLAAGAAGLGAFVVPGPYRIATMGWLGPAPSLPVLLILAVLAFFVFVGAALGIWRVLTNQWPPREAIGVLVIVVAARLALDVIRMMGLWIL